MASYRFIPMTMSTIGIVKDLRGASYSPETSVADIVDNCLPAGATAISVIAQWNDGDPVIEILDDGHGMTSRHLFESALSLGATASLTERKGDDIGNYGFGLKKAAFKLGTNLIVATKTRGGLICAGMVDTDEILQQGEYGASEPTELPPSDALERLREMPQGTLVRISNIDWFKDKTDKGNATFHETCRRILAHLEEVHHMRIAEDGLVITVNGKKAVPRDPCHSDSNNTQTIVVRRKAGRANVRVSAYLVDTSDKDVDEQGISVYYNRRLILKGSYMGLPYRKHTRFSAVRIRIEIDSSIEDWDISHLKDSASIPRIPEIRDAIRKVIDRAQMEALEAHNARYQHVGTRTKDASDEDIWLPNGGGEGCPTINRMHPTVMAALSDNPSLEDVFSDIEDGLPRFAMLDIHQPDAADAANAALSSPSENDWAPETLVSFVREIAPKMPTHLIADEINKTFEGLFTASQIAAAIRSTDI